MATVTVKDAFNFALQLEENGRDFFEKCARYARREEVQKLFLFLAEEEKKHITTFKKMLDGVEKAKAPVLTDKRSAALLEAYAKAFFPGEAETGKKSLKHLKAEEAVGFGIKIEQNAINYYKKLKSIVPESDRADIEGILEEEKQHYEKFSRLQKTLRQSGG